MRLAPSGRSNGPSIVSEEDLSRSIYELTIRAPNSVLEALSSTPLWNQISSASEDQNWWHRRTEYLVKQDLIPRIGDWARVYASLEKNGLKFNSYQDYGSTILVQVLLEIGADPSRAEGQASERINTSRMLEKIIRANNPQVLILLLNDGRLKPAHKNYLFGMSVRMDRLELVKILLNDEDVDPSMQNNQYLIVAARNGYKKIVELLLALPKEKRIDPSANDNEAIDNAIGNGFIATARLLLADKRTDPSLGDNVVFQAASIGDLDLVRDLLMDPRVDPSDDDNDAIRSAARLGFLDIVELLLSVPAVRAQRKLGLEEAVNGNHIEIVRLLARESIDSNEDEILSTAVKMGNAEIVRLLLRDGTHRLQSNAIRIARIRKRKDLEEILLTHPDLREQDEKNAMEGRE